MASCCWLGYFLTFNEQYDVLEGDAGDWELVPIIQGFARPSWNHFRRVAGEGIVLQAPAVDKDAKEEDLKKIGKGTGAKDSKSDKKGDKQAPTTKL